MIKKEYLSQGSVVIERSISPIEPDKGLTWLYDQLNTHQGAVFTSNYEYPGRYNRFEFGFVNPPLVLKSKESKFEIAALNERGTILLKIIYPFLTKLSSLDSLNFNGVDKIEGILAKDTALLLEERRSRKNSIFTIVRALIQLFSSNEDKLLGLYGAFGYDLVFQYEDLIKTLPRDAYQDDCVLYLPDEIFKIDHGAKEAIAARYDFTLANLTTKTLPRSGKIIAFEPLTLPPKQMRNHTAEEYAEKVKIAKEKFICGDLFEVVLSQSFFRNCEDTPAQIFQRLQKANPSPYGFLINLGDREFLVGSSPEMYLRVHGKRVESCPISGTIERGQDALSDAKQIQKLINSAKDEAELTMCTDVDRNDKSRICVPGSVQIIGRRQIEMYSRVIHTVDHVEGLLQKEFDALDAFLTHMWVVTVTGAPKLWAMKFIEQHEKTPRGWYGGAVGMVYFNGDLHTGLTIRTMHIKNGVAEVRAGATLLYDSDPAAEEQETELKAQALLLALKPVLKSSDKTFTDTLHSKHKILLVDHQDSFVHTLGNYFRQTGAEILTVRDGFLQQDPDFIDQVKPDLIVLSPGPGKPDDFEIKLTIAKALEKKIPIFGVCLGLQAIVEYFGGHLKTLCVPMHGKASSIKINNSQLFKDLPENFKIGRYHSLYADPENFPSCLKVTATADDGTIMAIEHTEKPVWAVQFHPESILSLEHQHGLKIILNVVRALPR